MAYRHYWVVHNRLRNPKEDPQAMYFMAQERLLAASQRDQYNKDALKRFETPDMFSLSHVLDQDVDQDKIHPLSSYFGNSPIKVPGMAFQTFPTK